jgi:hypothetical protein
VLCLEVVLRPFRSAGAEERSIDSFDSRMTAQGPVPHCRTAGGGHPRRLRLLDDPRIALTESKEQDFPSPGGAARILTMAKELYLTCTDCKSEFLADMQMDESSLSVFEGNSQECPSCGALTSLTHETAVFRDEAPSKARL